LARNGKCNLTLRELQILEYASHGGEYKQSKNYIGCGYQTMKNHLYNIHRFLNAENTTHAVAIALRRGLIS